MTKKFLFVGIIMLLCVGGAFGALTDNNVIYYSFDESDVSSATMIDLSTGGNNGTCTGMGGDCNTVEGLLLNSSDFDSTDDLVDTGFNNFGVSGASFSISVWINTTSLADRNGIFATGIAQDDGVTLTVHTDGDIQLWGYNAGGTTFSVLTTDNPVSVNTWYHIVTTYDGTNAKLYLDGAEYITSTNASGTIDSHDGNGAIGEYYLGWAGREFLGEIDEFALWTKELNSTEVTQLYNSGAGYNPYTPTVTNLTFTANNVYDNSAISAFNITINGTTYESVAGTVTTAITDSSTASWNYNFTATNYFNQSGTVNASNATTEQVDSFQAVLTLQGVELISNDILTGVTFNSSAQSGTTLYVDAGTIPVDAVKSGYYNLSTQDYNITALTNTTQNFSGMYNSKLTIYAWDYVNSTHVHNFTVNLTSLNESYALQNTTNGASITYNLIQDSYNITIDHPQYVPVTVTQVAGFATTLNQTVTPYNSINFSFIDQDTNALVDDRNISITLLGNTTNYQLITATGNLFVSDLAAEEYTITYGAEGYDNRTYYFSLVNRTTNNLTLYMLNSSGLTTTYITIIDEYGDEVEDAIVKALKYSSVTNSYLLQEAVPTNFEGVAIMDLQHDTGYYYFIVEYPAGTTVKTTTPTYIYSTTLTIQVILEGSAAEDFFALGNIYHNLYFDESNDRFVFVYNDGADLVSEGCMEVYRVRSTGNTLENRTCVTGAANTFAVNVTNGTAITYLAKGIVNIGEEYVIDEEEYRYPQSQAFAGLGLFFTILLMIVFASIGFTKDISTAVLITPIPLILMNAIGFIHLSWGIVISIQIVGAILSFVLARDN